MRAEEENKRRTSAWWKIRGIVGGILQGWVWWLHDPCDSWAIEYTNERGRRCGITHKGFYSHARIRAKELNNGKVIAWRCEEIPYDEAGTTS